MPWSDCFLRQSISINCRTKTKQNKNKSKKGFVGVTEKYLKTGILKHIMGSYPREINVQNALEYS